MTSASFNGLRVLSLESRYAKDISNLIASHGGKPIMAPAIREVTLESDSRVLVFAAGLMEGQFDMVIFLTGTGIRALLGGARKVYACADLRAALERVQVVARGLKPSSALIEFGVKPNLVAAEPYTWREVLRVLDDSAGPKRLQGLRIAVQEYGVPCTALVAGLQERGALVTSLPIYSWSFPEDLVPLQHAARLIAQGEIDVILLTAPAQAQHLFQVAAAMGIEESIRGKMERMVIASVGPTTSEHLGSLGMRPDFQASHSRMGYLVERPQSIPPKFFARN